MFPSGVRGQLLEQMGRGDLRRYFVRAARVQDCRSKAAAAFAGRAVFQRAKWKYQRRGCRDPAAAGEKEFEGTTPVLPPAVISSS